MTAITNDTYTTQLPEQDIFTQENIDPEPKIEQPITNNKIRKKLRLGKG